MSTVELISSKSRSLSEEQARAVLTFMDGLTGQRAPSATELMRLPPDQRRHILAAQARQAEAVYRADPQMIDEDTEAPLNHAEGEPR